MLHLVQFTVGPPELWDAWLRGVVGDRQLHGGPGGRGAVLVIEALADQFDGQVHLHVRLVWLEAGEPGAEDPVHYVDRGEAVHLVLVVATRNQLEGIRLAEPGGLRPAVALAGHEVSPRVGHELCSPADGPIRQDPCDHGDGGRIQPGHRTASGSARSMKLFGSVPGWNTAVAYTTVPPIMNRSARPCGRIQCGSVPCKTYPR